MATGQVPKTDTAAIFKKAGFKRDIAPTKKRVVLALDGADKEGKTHFALTAPKPMGYISLDFGTDGVIQKFADDDIWLAEFRVNIRALKELKTQDASGEAKKTVAAIMKAYEEVLGHARTIVFDKATQLWELMRMAEFGKLDHVKGHHYVEVNAQWRDVIQLAYDQDKTNLILIHGLKDEYVANERTGKRERAGMKETGGLVQCNALCWRDTSKDAPGVPDCFHTTVMNCRQNAEMAGLDFYGEDCNFPTIAQMIFPDTKIGDWM